MSWLVRFADPKTPALNRTKNVRPAWGNNCISIADPDIAVKRYSGHVSSKP